jgi:deoxyhypusine synthase
MGPVKTFIKRHLRHFNAATTVEAAEGWLRHLAGGGKMMLTMGGAMSTAELGIVLAELIRRGMIHAMTVTGANLEEDVFNLVAHDHYVRLPGYRDLTPQAEQELLGRHLNRVTDTCLPEEEAMRKIERKLADLWAAADRAGERRTPQEFFYRLIRSQALADEYQIDPKDSWLVAAAEQDLPLWVPGWEDSTLGNMFVANVIKGKVGGYGVVKSGLEQMADLVAWYRENARNAPIGFFQIGGGISGDFPICVVPLIEQDLETPIPKWAYFCQISDATTSYGSYSGAVPNEKITWGKLDMATPSYIIESDATIVFPLIAAYLLDW